MRQTNAVVGTSWMKRVLCEEGAIAVVTRRAAIEVSRVCHRAEARGVAAVQARHVAAMF